MRGDLLEGTVWLVSIWLYATLVVAAALTVAVTSYLSLRLARMLR